MLTAFAIAVWVLWFDGKPPRFVWLTAIADTLFHVVTRWESSIAIWKGILT